MEKCIIANGCALRISDSVSGDNSVVLLHGYLESLAIWEDFAKILSKTFRVITLDLPGHGISEVKAKTHTMRFLADTVADVMRQLGIERYAVVGHSMGGYVALELLANYSNHLSALVLFHSTPNADSQEKKENRKREIALIESGKKELLAKTFPSKGFAAENRKRFQDDIEAVSLQISITEDEGIVAILNGMMERNDMNEIMRNATLPELMIFGRKDEYITPEIAQTVIENHPQAEVEWLENSGHNGFIEEERRSAEIIQFFLTDIR